MSAARRRTPAGPLLAALSAALWPGPARADFSTAVRAMEDPGNPLVLMTTSKGPVYIEMLPGEAPENVANFIALAQGEVEFRDPASGAVFAPRYFDGMRFHRVVPGFVAQAGSPALHPLGSPAVLPGDEINADSLGLDAQPLIAADGRVNRRLNAAGRSEFAEEVLAPLYRVMGIDSEPELLERQREVAGRLAAMSLKDAYENQGYRYRDGPPTRAVVRGVVALAGEGPGRNGPEFFIALRRLPWLSGRHTVIGKVVEGMDAVDRIGATAAGPESPPRDGAVIYSVRRIDREP